MLQAAKYYNARGASVRLIDQNNYTYTKEKVMGAKTYWTCSKYMDKAIQCNIADYYEEGVLKFTESMTEDESWGEYEDEINKFIHYLEKTWIGRVLGRSNARQSPMFKYEMWNIHVDILDGSKFTSNSVEAWNNAWNSSLEKNASVWTVVQGFRREDGIVKGKLRDIMFGNLPSEDNRGRAGGRKSRDSQVQTFLGHLDSNNRF